LEAEIIRFCLSRQHNRVSVTILDLVDLLGRNEINLDRLRVRNFVVLCFQKAAVIEKGQSDVSSDDMTRCCDPLGEQVKSIPSPFVWNMDGTRAESSKKITPPEAVVAINPKFGWVPVAGAGDDPPLSLLTSISALRDSYWTQSTPAKCSDEPCSIFSSF
jgi:hypothetical protein